MIKKIWFLLLLVFSPQIMMGAEIDEKYYTELTTLRIGLKATIKALETLEDNCSVQDFQEASKLQANIDDLKKYSETEKIFSIQTTTWGERLFETREFNTFSWNYNRGFQFFGHNRISQEQVKSLKKELISYLQGRLTIVDEQLAERQLSKDLKQKTYEQLAQNLANAPTQILKTILETGEGTVKAATSAGIKARATADATRDNFRELMKPENLKNIGLTTAGVLAISGVCITMAWHGGHVGFNELQKRLNKPKLIKETTRPENMWQMIVGKNLEENRLDEFVWPDGLQTRLEYLIEQTLQANEAESSFKNVLLYGPPGTGKTMFAKSLARASGVHYAMFSGADFNNFESLAEAQAELDNIITWGENSDKGIIIFVDEADCFLVERTFPDTTPRQCALTNMFLSRVEKPSSNKIMWVFCTNNRGSLDIAVESRISEAYEFKRPSDKNGMQILLQYLEQKDVLLTEAIKKEIVKISSNLVGLSGRDIQEIAEEIARRLNINNITLDFDLIKTAIEEKKDNLTAMAQAQAEYRRARYNRT